MYLVSFHREKVENGPKPNPLDPDFSFAPRKSRGSGLEIAGFPGVSELGVWMTWIRYSLHLTVAVVRVG